MKFFRKALLDETIKMCQGLGWVWYFYGLTIGQYGFGIIWREKECEHEWIDETNETITFTPTLKKGEIACSKCGILKTE